MLWSVIYKILTRNPAAVFIIMTARLTRFTFNSLSQHYYHRCCNQDTLGQIIIRKAISCEKQLSGCSTSAWATRFRVCTDNYLNLSPCKQWEEAIKSQPSAFFLTWWLIYLWLAWAVSPQDAYSKVHKREEAAWMNVALDVAAAVHLRWDAEVKLFMSWIQW